MRYYLMHLYINDFLVCLIKIEGQDSFISSSSFNFLFWLASFVLDKR